MLPFAFDGIPDESEAEVDARTAFLSSVDPVLYDCCPRSCCCYAGPYEDFQQCPICQESRFNSAGRARKTFTYIPLIPRLIGLYRNKAMAQKLRYRHKFQQSSVRHPEPIAECEDIRRILGVGKPGTCYCPSAVEDIFDGNLYRALRDTTVTVNGQPLSHTFFSDKRDIALGLSTDGFTPFKRRNQSCWPLILYNYNLPPEERFHQENIICVGVIPGPKKPSDSDSFLWPLVEELIQLEGGVKAFDAGDPEGVLFALHGYVLLGAGDIPAISMLMKMKGHNAFCPCRMCKILGVQIPNGSAKVYYIPLDRSRHPSVVSPAAGSSPTAKYSPLDLPLRTHTEFMAQARHVMESPSMAEEGRRAKACGIKGLPLLRALQSLSFPSSFPYDFMHLFWENLLPNPIELWTGVFKGLDQGSQSYQLNKSVWEAIGQATAESGASIPSSFGPRLPNIDSERSYYTADMMSFWTLYLGPVLLHRKFTHAKYFEHFTALVRLLHMCLKFALSYEDIKEIRVGFAAWVEKYEE